MKRVMTCLILRHKLLLISVDIVSMNSYDDLRKQLFKDMSSIVPNFDNFCLYDKFLYIMSVSELDMIPIVVLYVDNCLKIRQQYQDSSQHSGTLVFN